MAASSTAISLLLPLPSRRLSVGIAPPRAFPGRRQCGALILLAGVPSPAMAADIPLFGLRKQLRRVEEEIVEEGERVVEAVEEEIQAVEEGAASFRFAGDALQAAAVLAVEAVGVLVGVSVVNGILGPEKQSR